MTERQIKVTKTRDFCFVTHCFLSLCSILDLVSKSVKEKSFFYLSNYKNDVLKICFSRMKWKKENNFKSLNDPNVKLEANASSHGSSGHNHHPHAMSTNDATSSSWSSVSNVKKENNPHLSQHAHQYVTNGNSK